jgi:hypothetical protein
MKVRRALRGIGRGVAALLGLGFVSAAYMYLTLPDVRPLRTENPASTAFMNLRASEAHARGLPATRDWRWVPYARISANLKKAVITTEDGAFWQHAGIDYEQLRESIETNWELGEFKRGASTITQQLAVEEPDPERQGAAHHAAARVRALQAADPRDLPERDRVGGWHLGRGSGGAPLFPQAGRRAERARVGAPGGRDRQPPHPRSRPPERPAAPPPADDHAPDGRRDPATGRRRAVRAASGGPRRAPARSP